MTDIDAIFERAAMAAEAREARDLAELRAAGVAPASREGEAWVGMHLFGIGLRLPYAGVAEIRLNLAGAPELSWGGSWPHAGARIDAAEFLAVLAGAWGLVGQAYREPRDEPRPGSVSIAPEADGGPLPALEIRHDGEGMTVSVGDVRHDFGRESVIVAQVLMTVGDLVADSLPAEAPEASAWRRARAATDLPPFAVDGDAAADTFGDETAWFARKAGLPVETYRLAALDVMSRQVTHPETGLGEPPVGDWHPGHVRDGLTREAVAPLAARGAAALGCEADEFERQAVGTRNSDAFQAIFYGGRFDLRARGHAPAPGLTP